MSEELDSASFNTNYQVLKETADWLSGQKEPDIDQLWRRLSRRNVRPEETPLDRSTLESSLASWESPDESELSQYDAYYLST